MILGVDGLRLLGQRAGVGRALESILGAMGGVQHPFDEIRVYSPAPVPDDVRLPERARNIVAGGWLPRGVWQQVALPRMHRRVGLLLCPSYVVPWIGASPTFLIHHGSYEGFPAAFPLLKRAKWRLIHTLSARRATRITTVSEHSKRDMVRFYGVDPRKIDVVPEGVDTELFRPIDDAGLLADWRVRRRTGADPFLLYVGNPSPRRNLPALIEAFGRLKRESGIPHRLLLAGMELPGSPIDGLVDDLDLRDHIVTIGYASHEELALAYNAADLFVYPSSYEGFGIPVLEAMACGTPVVTIDNTAFPEFAGGVARLLPDARVETLERGIGDALADDQWRAETRQSGPRRAGAYDWRTITRRYVELMAEAAV